MLCNYLSYWWEKGPENSAPGAQCCTMVTSEHLSIILGNILKILNNNLGIDDAPWMKRIAGKCQAGCTFLFFKPLDKVKKLQWGLCIHVFEGGVGKKQNC